MSAHRYVDVAVERGACVILTPGSHTSFDRPRLLVDVVGVCGSEDVAVGVAMLMVFAAL